MKQDAGRVYRFSVQDKEVTVFPGRGIAGPVVYLHVPSGEEAYGVYETLCAAGMSEVTLAAVSGLVWERDMVPWDIPPVFRGGASYHGGADGYLRLLTDEIMKKTEALAPGRILWRGLAGYSLGGLFALYAAYRTEMFGRFASISGSLWAPGWKEYMLSHEMKSRPERVYLSLGDREAQTGNPCLKTVWERTKETEAFYAEQGIRTMLEINPGNHCQDTVKRTAAGIAWILEE